MIMIVTSSSLLIFPVGFLLLSYIITWHIYFEQIHRRKIRAWQMLCVLSRFVTDDTVKEVTHSLHISLYVSVAPQHFVCPPISTLY